MRPPHHHLSSGRAPSCSMGGQIECWPRENGCYNLFVSSDASIEYQGGPLKEESVPLLLSPSLPLLLNGGSALNNMYHWCRLIINKPSSNLQLISQVTRLNCNSAATPPHALAVSTGETRARGYQTCTKGIPRGYQKAYQSIARCRVC